MKPKVKMKRFVDIAMTAALLLLMSYGMTGQAVHEWIGVGMFVLFVLHHILNSRWSRNLRKGKYSALRIIQTVLVTLVLLSMLGSMVSGVMLSRYALSFLPINGGYSFARSLHMLSAYWGFVFMSLHLGFHWSMMMGMAGKLVKGSSKIRTWVLRGIAALISGYGVYAFARHNISSYMFLKYHFAFFDFEEPLLLFLLDYSSIMVLFAAVGHYVSKAVKSLHRKPPKADFIQ